MPKKPMKSKAAIKTKQIEANDVPSEEQQTIKTNEEDSFLIEKDDDDFDSHLQKQADRIL